LKHYRNIALILTVGLTILTILSCLSHVPQGPFDARDYTRVAGMRLEQHPWVALIEPLVAPLQVMSGAPDFRIAGASLLIWVFFAAGAWTIFAEIRLRRANTRLAVVRKVLWSAFAASATLVLVILFFVMARIPGWRLIVNDPDMIVADLHSHTIKSFDGLVSAKTNLLWHASCGYGLAGLTEHDFLFAHDTETAADPAFERLPAFISGLEVHSGPRVMVVAVCGESHVQLAVPQHVERQDSTSWFAGEVHDDCDGAVFVVTLNRLRPGDVARLADSGVDGFEIVNSGHPELRPDLRQEVLDVRRSRGLALVASSDWHGWSGLARTWTVIRAKGASSLSHKELAKIAVSKLRQRYGTDVIPVVAGYMGTPSLMRVIFSPIVETVRYAQELSLVRVLSWWAWAWGLFVLWALMRRIGLSPGSVILAALVGLTGLGLIFAGLSLLGEGAGDATPYSIKAVIITITVGAVAFLISLTRGLLMWRTGRLAKRRN
jgi:hypothetical protein